MDFIFIVIIFIMSVVIHEVSHGYAALALGDSTAKYQGRLTLNPVSHLDPIGSLLVPVLGFLLGGFIIGWAKPVPFNPYNLRNQRWGEALVAAAGPASNFILAVIFGLFIRFSAGYGFLNPSFLSLAYYVVYINLILGIFNLIPIPPLDGSKILFSFIPYRFHILRDRIERYGLIFVFIFVFFLWQLMRPLAQYLFLLVVGRPVF